MFSIVCDDFVDINSILLEVILYGGARKQSSSALMSVYAVEGRFFVVLE